MSIFGKKIDHDHVRQTLYSQSPDGVMTIADGIIVDCNDSCVNMFAYVDKQALIGSDPAALSPLIQHDGRPSDDKSGEVIAECLRMGHSRFEWDHLRADNSVFPVLATMIAVTVNGRTLLIASVSDLSPIFATRERLGRESDRLVQQFEQDVSTLLANAKEAVDRVNESATEQAALTSKTTSNVQTVATAQQLTTNLLGFIRLTAAMLPLLQNQPSSTIMNVTSGLAFLPGALVPTYSATKAAMHSYTLSLRFQHKTT